MGSVFVTKTKHKDNSYNNLDLIEPIEVQKVSSSPVQILTHKRNPWHLVKPSVFPFLLSLALMNFVILVVCWLHNIQVEPFCRLWDSNVPLVVFTFCQFLYIMGAWLWDVVIEGTYFGHHTFAVERSLRYGMALFILSEVMFFFSFFWAFFHSSLNPSINIGGVWPPAGIEPVDPWGIPFLNTVLLLSSGVTVTFAHYSFFIRSRAFVTYGLALTIFLGLLFTGIQGFEYVHTPFTICDSIYGSCFYMLTGFHGFHVLVGSIFLLVTFVRHLMSHFSDTYHFGFEAAAWYWHFVDVVWIFLFGFVYVWGG